MEFNTSLVPEIELSSVISDIASGPFGSSIKVSSLVSSGFPLLDGANLKGFKVTDNITKFVTDEKAQSLERSIAHRGDVVSTIRGTLGQIAYVPEDSKYMGYLCSQSQFRITFDKEKVYPPFIVFYFHTSEGQQKLLSFASQVGVPALTQPLKNFPKIKIFLPDYFTQKRIAKVIELLNEKIENNNKINDNLLAQARALYKAWFIDYVPFGGSQPEGWNSGKLKDVLTLKRNAIRAGENTKLPYLPIDVIPMNTFALSDVKPNEEAQSSLITFDKDDIVIGAMRVYFHRVIIAPFAGITRTTCFTLKPTDKDYLCFGLLCCDQDSSIDYAQSTSKGSTMPYAIWEGGLGDMDIIIPDKNTIREFNELILPMIRVIQSSYEETKHLRDLRNSLLPRLMSGEIDVSNITL